MPAIVLKRCADVLALPVTLLIRHLLRLGCWPRGWASHWICALFKSGSAFDPKRYRGVHLTPVLSKVCERAVKHILHPFLASAGAFGLNQWAYQRNRSSRDLLALLVATWPRAFEDGQKIGALITDISGAFDRVRASRLVDKLRSAGVCEIAFIEDWLRPRTAQVAVGGALSVAKVLSDMVFQGTVLGPDLWNVFFADVADAVRSVGAEEAIFADDLSAFKRFETKIEDVEVMDDMTRCQQAVHKWGRANQVIFEGTKEKFAIIHHTAGTGEDFKLLGLEFDVKLVMRPCAEKLATKAQAKLTALLRTRAFYDDPAIIRSYKAHVLCILELGAAAFYHASDSVLDALDRSPCAGVGPR